MDSSSPVFFALRCGSTCAQLFNELLAAKTSPEFWKSLSTRQLLSSDFKMFPISLGPVSGSIAPSTTGLLQLATCSVLIPLEGPLLVV